MKKYFLFAAAALVLTACSNDDVPAPAQSSDIATISASIGNVKSRAAGTSWSARDKIGITTTGNTKEYVNMEYTVDDVTAGTFTGTPIYFQKNGVDVTFTAYYPFTGTEGTLPSQPVDEPIVLNNTRAANQAADTQPGIDYLWAQAHGSRTNPDVTFTFAHKMSKLTLTFKNGADTDVSDITGYTVDGFVLDGFFNVTTGEAGLASSKAEALTMDVANVAAGIAVPSIILYPQAVNRRNIQLSVVLDGEIYKCVLPMKHYGLIAGYDYNFTIRIDKTGMTVVGSEITDWIPAENDEIGAEMPE